MTTPSPPLVASRLEKAATDNGFDVTLGREGDWLAFASSQTSLRLWLATFGDALYVVALSQPRVAGELGGLGTPLASPLPPGAVAGRSVGTVRELHELVPYQTRLDLPPADPRVAHPESTRSEAAKRGATP